MKKKTTKKPPLELPTPLRWPRGEWKQLADGLQEIKGQLRALSALVLEQIPFEGERHETTEDRHA